MVAANIVHTNEFFILDPPITDAMDSEVLVDDCDITIGGGSVADANGSSNSSNIGKKKPVTLYSHVEIG